MNAHDHGTVLGLAEPELDHQNPVGTAPLGIAASDAQVCSYVRDGMARELREVAAVARFLDQVGGTHA
jgi:hypothetical protein